MTPPRSTPTEHRHVVCLSLVVTLVGALLLVAPPVEAAPPSGPAVVGSTRIAASADHRLALDRDSGRLFVSSDESGRIQVVDTPGLRHDGALLGSCCQPDLATDPGLGTLYATWGDAGMDAFLDHGTTAAQPVTFDGFRSPGVLAVDPVHHVVYTVDGFEGAVVAVDGRTLREVAFLNLAFITGIAVDPVSSTLFAVEDSGLMTFMDTASGRSRGQLALGRTTLRGSRPTPVWDPVLHRVHVLLGHEVVSVDPLTRRVTGRTWLPRGFYDGFTIDSSRHRLYATRSWTDQSFQDRSLGHEVAVLDARHRRAPELVRVGLHPTDIEVDPSSGRVYVACRDRLVVLAAST